MEELRLIPIGTWDALQDEWTLFTNVAARLGTGEAQTAALAVSRGAEVATDDRKAIRLLEAQTPAVTVHRTTSLVYHWANSTGVEAERLRDVLAAIRDRSRFMPGRHDPLQPWWINAISL